LCIHDAAHYFCIVWFEPNFKLIQKDLKMSLKMLERKRKTDSFSPSHPFWFLAHSHLQPASFLLAPAQYRGQHSSAPFVFPRGLLSTAAQLPSSFHRGLLQQLPQAGPSKQRAGPARCRAALSLPATLTALDRLSDLLPPPSRVHLGHLRTVAVHVRLRYVTVPCRPSPRAP